MCDNNPVVTRGWGSAANQREQPSTTNKHQRRRKARRKPRKFMRLPRNNVRFCTFRGVCACVKGGLSLFKDVRRFSTCDLARNLPLTPRLVCDEYRKTKLAAICLFLREMLIRLEAGFGEFQRGVLRHIPLRCRFVCGGIGCTLQRKDRQKGVREMTISQIMCRRRKGATFLRRSIHFWRPAARPASRVGKWV